MTRARALVLVLLAGGCAQILGIDTPTPAPVDGAVAFLPDAHTTFDAVLTTPDAVLTTPDAAPLPDARSFDAAPPPPLNITIDMVGFHAGFGAEVVSTPAGIDCPGTSCQASFPSGMSVVLHAVTTNGAQFGGFRGAGCPLTSGDCTVVPGPATSVVKAGFYGGANLIFVSSTKQSAGALGGLAGADALCNQLAVNAGLPGKFVAWLSSSTATATSRLMAQVSPSGWFRVDDQPFAFSVAGLTSGAVYYPPRLDENGDVADDLVITGTGPNGMAAATGGSCAGYTSTTELAGIVAGSPNGGTNSWTSGALTTCAQPARIYCLGDEYVAAVASMTVTTPVMWVSKGLFTPGAGTAAADALCAQDASDASIPASGHAVLGKQVQAPLGGSPPMTIGSWQRGDGFELAPSTSDFLSSTTLLESAPNVGLDRSYYGGKVWLGSSGFFETQAAYTCLDWTSTAGVGAVYDPTFALKSEPFGAAADTMPCSTALPVFCVAYTEVESRGVGR